MNYVSQGVTMLSALVLTPLLVHHLGQSAFGIWVLASSIVAYLELLELGFGSATTKLISEDADVRPDQVVRTLNTNFFVLVPLGVLALGLGVGVAVVFPHFVHVGTNLRDQVAVVVAVLAVGLAISIPGDAFGGALMGHQRFDLLASSNALFTITVGVTSVLIVELGGGLIPLAIATASISVAFHGIRWLMLRRILPGARISPRLVERHRIRLTTRLSGWFLVAAILSAIYQTCDVLIVGIVLGVKAAAIYAVGSRLAKAAVQSMESMGTVFFPHASAQARNSDRESLAQTAVDGTRAMLLIGVPLSLLLTVLAAPGIRAWVGPGYGTSAEVLLVLAIAFGLASPVRTLQAVIAGSGRVRVLCAITAVEVAVNFTLSIVLAHAIGPVGVALGTLAGIVLVRLPVVLLVGSREVKIRAYALLRGGVLPHLLPTIVCAGVLLAGRPLAQRSIPGLALVAIAGIATYLVIYFSFGATPTERARAAGVMTKVLATSKSTIRSRRVRTGVDSSDQ
jgi:O-antigen/teichoic acid export membrane protein